MYSNILHLVIEKDILPVYTIIWPSLTFHYQLISAFRSFSDNRKLEDRKIVYKYINFTGTHLVVIASLTH